MLYIAKFNVKDDKESMGFSGHAGGRFQKMQRHEGQTYSHELVWETDLNALLVCGLACDVYGL